MRWPRRGRGRRPAVNYNVRFYPLCLEMRDRVARGDLGRILSVTGSYTQDWLLLPDDYNWRVEPDGGTNLRAVADIGTHWMDLAQFVAGPADPLGPGRPGDVPPRAATPGRTRPRRSPGPGDRGRPGPVADRRPRTMPRSSCGWTTGCAGSSTSRR